MPRTPLRVMLVDDHAVLREGLRALLEQAGVDVIAEVGEGQAALALLGQCQPDVVILDCQLPDMSRVEVAATIQERRLPTRVLALSAYSDPSLVQAMLQAGAVGYLLKEVASSAIVAAVEAAARGESGLFSPSIAQLLAAWARGETPGGLTEREQAVLRLTVEGQSNKEIGQSLSISEKAVEKHLTSIYGKLGVDSKVSAAVLAVRQGLV